MRREEKLTKRVTVNFSESELAQIEGEALRQDRTSSSLIRWFVLPCLSSVSSAGASRVTGIPRRYVQQAAAECSTFYVG